MKEFKEVKAKTSRQVRVRDCLVMAYDTAEE